MESRSFPIPDGLDGSRVDAGLAKLLGFSRSFAAEKCRRARASVSSTERAKPSIASPSAVSATRSPPLGAALPSLGVAAEQMEDFKSLASVATDASRVAQGVTRVRYEVSSIAGNLSTATPSDLLFRSRVPSSVQKRMRVK